MLRTRVTTRGIVFMCSLLRWPFGGFKDKHVYRRAARLEAQFELFLDRGEQRRAIRRRTDVGASRLWIPLQLQIEAVRQARRVDDKAPGGGAEPGGELPERHAEGGHVAGTDAPSA